MSEYAWYKAVSPKDSVTQGDIILRCPVLTWNPEKDSKYQDDPEELSSKVLGLSKDVIVLSQACDLEEYKIEDVIFCPHVELDIYKQIWETYMRSKKQSPTSKAWGRFCEDVKKGYIWHLAMINEANISEIPMTHRIIDFHYVHTLPRITLEQMIESRGEDRLRLLPPYREHISQAFARFFMRVGLPSDVRVAWEKK